MSLAIARGRRVAWAVRGSDLAGGCSADEEFGLIGRDGPVFERSGSPAIHQRNVCICSEIAATLYLPSHNFKSSAGSGPKKASVILILPFMAPNFRLPAGM